MTLPDLAESYRILTTEPAAVRLARDVVRVSGPDAGSWLQGQVSQDILALTPVGEGSPDSASAWSFILAPQGKVDAWFRVTRETDESFLLDLDPGYATTLVDRLNRFKLRVKAEIEVLDTNMLAIRDAADGAAQAPSSDDAGASAAGAVFFGAGFDIFGADAVAPDGLVEVSADAYEVLRIEAGMPKMGAELDENTIPAASGVVDLSASFTKGCYTGQELVARVDSRGSNTPTHLRVLRSEGEISVGDVIGDDQGTITSASVHPDGGSVALGYVKRSVEVPCSLIVGENGDGGTEAVITPVPSAADPVE